MKNKLFLSLFLVCLISLFFSCEDATEDVIPEELTALSMWNDDDPIWCDPEPDPSDPPPSNPWTYTCSGSRDGTAATLADIQCELRGTGSFQAWYCEYKNDDGNGTDSDLTIFRRRGTEHSGFQRYNYCMTFTFGKILYLTLDLAKNHTLTLVRGKLDEECTKWNGRTSLPAGQSWPPVDVNCSSNNS